MSHGQDFTSSSQFLFLSSEFVLFQRSVKRLWNGILYLCNWCLLGVFRAVALEMLARLANGLTAAPLQPSSDRSRPGGSPAVCFSVSENGVDPKSRSQLAIQW